MKHLMKAEEHTYSNIVFITMNMKTIVRIFWVIKNIYPRGLNKGFSFRFYVGSWSDKDYSALIQKFQQITFPRVIVLYVKENNFLQDLNSGHQGQ